MDFSDVLQIISIIVAIFFGLLTLNCNKKLKKVKTENNELKVKVEQNSGVIAKKIEGGVKIEH